MAKPCGGGDDGFFGGDSVPEAYCEDVLLDDVCGDYHDHWLFRCCYFDERPNSPEQTEDILDRM